MFGNGTSKVNSIAYKALLRVNFISVNQNLGFFFKQEQLQNSCYWYEDIKIAVVRNEKIIWSAQVYSKLK